MTCKIAYTEKLLTKISRKKKRPNAKIRWKKIVEQTLFAWVWKKVTKPIIYSRKKQNPCYKMLWYLSSLYIILYVKQLDIFMKKFLKKFETQFQSHFSKMISPKTQIHDTKSSGRNMKIKIKQKRKVKQENS